MQFIDKEFHNCTQEQCWGFVGCAGEIANNVFAAGGLALSVRAGRWDSERPDTWVPGYDEARDYVMLSAQVGADPYTMDGVEDDADAFAVPFYQLDVGQGHEKRARTIAELLALERIPMLESGAAITIALRHWDPFYTVKKVISDLWGTLLQRGGLEMGVQLRKGPLAKDQMPVVKGVDKATGQSITQMESVEYVPVYVVFDKQPSINIEDVVSIRSFESAYDPTWQLAALLQGKYSQHNQFQSDGSAQ
jgi:hypothetical protein